MKHTKRVFSVLLALLLLALSVPFAVAEDVTVVDSGTAYNLTWSLDSAGTLTISGEGQMYNYSTTSDNGFNRTNAPWGKYYQTIQSVVIGDSVTSIGERAFYGCTALESVTIGDSVTSIGSYTFYNCTSLASVTIPDSVESIGSSAFSDSTALESVTIGNSVESIGNSAFRGCTALESVTIPDSVTSIGNEAFSSCTALKSVTIGDSVTSIGGSAFSGCTALESVTIGDSVTNIGKYAFSSCTALKSVTIGNSVTSIGNSAFRGCTALESVTIGDSVTTIGDSVFYGCTALESVTLPDNITSIGSSAFSSDYSWYTLALCNKNSTTAATLAATSFPYAFLDGTDEDNLIHEQVNASLSYTIDKRTRTMTVQTNGTMVSFASFDAPWLEYQKYITDVVILPGCTAVSAKAFRNCYYLIRVTLPEGIESINSSAFYECRSLMQINLPDSLETIGNYAFSNCSSLETVTIGDSVTSIGDYVFSGCTALASVTIPNSVTSIGSEAFSYCTALECVTIGDSVTSIGEWAFSGCTALESVTIGDSVTSIGNYAFSGCTALASVTIPDSVTSIGYRALYGCTALKSADLGSGLTSIGEYAFYNSGLESIVIPDSVKTLNGYSPFNSGYTYYCNNYGNTFASCRSLKTVVIGDGLDAIPRSAFSGCTALETVSIGDGVQGVYSYAFSGCTALGTVSIGENVTWISDYAFSGCTSLHTVVLPEKVKTLSRGAFPEKTLKDLYIYNAGQCDIAEDAVFYSATIHAYVDSPAATFFENRGYNFEPLTDAPAHEHDSTPVKGTPPTCTEAGLTDGYQCSVCGKWITKQKPIKALGHDYVLKETVLPTETENGFNRFECSRCDAAYTEVIPVSSHAHNYTVTDSRAATCLEDGFTTYVCYGCGHTYTDIVSAPGHTFGSWKTFLPTEAGVKGIDVRFCSVCGVYELRESETTGTGTGTGTGTETPTDPTHTHTFTLVDAKDATCELAGYKRYICTCGATKAEIIDALEHDYVIGATVPATCNETGYTPFVCARCGDEKKTDLVPALGHSWNSGYVTKEANCSTTGTILYTCTRDGCGETMEKTLPKNANVHEMKTVIVPATCTEQGYTQHTCLYCRYGFNDTIVPALGHADVNKDNKCDRCGKEINPTAPTDPCKKWHDFGEWIILRNATCTQEGSRKHICKRCNKEETQEIKALGHDYKLDEASKVASTCEKEGYSLSICTRCKDEVITHPAALGHADANNDNKCDRCGAQIQDSAHAQEPEEEELNFFQRIIQWFRNLFAGLFG